MKTLLILAVFCIAAIVQGRYGYAIGEFGVGINAGLTYDPNNVEGIIADCNERMLAYREANPGTRVTQIENQYVPVFGINFRYNFNYILFRIGGHYARSLSVSRGTISQSGVKNTIKIDTWQASVPGTIGLLVPLKKRALAYIGAGLNLNYASVSISQSKPGGGFITPDDRRNRYSGTFGGYHFLVGLEFPLTERYSISGEWLRMMGTSPAVKSSDTSNRATINMNSDIVMFGVNYYISI